MNAECFRGSCVAELIARDYGNEVDLRAPLGASGSGYSGSSSSIDATISSSLVGAAVVGHHPRKEATPQEIARECASVLRLTEDIPTAPSAPASAAAAVAAEGNGPTPGAAEAEEPSAPPASETDPSAAQTGGPSAVQLAEWNALRLEASSIPSRARIPLARAPTGYTRAAHDHGQVLAYNEKSICLFTLLGCFY